MVKSRSFSITGHMVDLFNDRIRNVEIQIENARIINIRDCIDVDDVFILPGFVDSHVHIESSMLIPHNFGEIAQKFGTVAAISDPHEIANINGIDGINFMIKDAKEAFIKIFYGAPSCVPATIFETAGSEITISDIENLLKGKGLKFLSEMMNFPAVIQNNIDEYKKIDIAKKYKKPIDGHAPGLTGKDLKKYINAGISTDHEIYTLYEAIEKIENGMIVQIREGSAAKNLDELFSIIDKFPDKVMFCTDDLHPDDLVQGHIDVIVRKAVKLGAGIFNILRVACINPVKHYKLNVGLLRINDSADFIVLEDLKRFKVLKTFVNGETISRTHSANIKYDGQKFFNRNLLNNDDIKVADLNKKIKIIQVMDKSLFTKCIIGAAKVENGNLVSDVDRDILKIVVLNRYGNSPPAIGFVKNFGIKNGAIVSSIAHDSHNIVCVGSDDENIIKVINEIIKNKGGIALSCKNELKIMTLPVAGIMTTLKAEKTAMKYKQLNNQARDMGSKLRSPFMTLSFMALIVIPELKLSDKGLFDVNKFDFTSLYCDN